MRTTFFFADWQVDPAANSLRRGKLVLQLEPKAMDVLLLLCQHAGKVLSSDDIVSQCWPGTDTGDNPLHKTITQLRKALGDSATKPTYIETIRKRGYRALAEVRYPLGQEQSAQQQSWQQGSPFPGLQAYDAKYASVFFGRGKQIDTLLARIAKQIQYGRAFCLLLGPSGSGKSSLINAGIMPNLMRPGGFNGIEVLAYSSIDLADVAPAQMLTDLASAMLDWELNDAPVFAGFSAQSLAQLLAAEPQQVVATCLQQLPKAAKTKARFALFIDRLEVLLASPLFSPAERTQFTQLLEQLASSGAVLVLSACRNEFYPLLVDYPSLMAGKAKGAHFDLAAPGRADLLQMIRLPALAAGLSFELEPDTATPLDELLCSEAASNPDALPMLQYTLQELYLQRSSDNKLLVSVYHALGGIEGAIGKNAEQAISALGSNEKASLPRVLSMLVTLREDEKSITSRSGRVAQLQTDAERTLVQTMVEQRLFVSQLQNGEPCFSIAHEALLRRWPRATAWISEHHHSLSVKSRLLHLTRRWQAEQQNSAYLLADGKPLQEAQTLLNNSLFSLDADEQRFIQASANKARFKRWTRRSTLALLCVLTVTAAAMSVRSFNAEQQAQQKRLAAENLLGFMVGEFADKLRSIGRMDLLDGISNKALEYFTDYSADNTTLSTEARLQHGQTLEAMGEVAYSRGKTEEATEALQAARVQLEAVLAQQPNNLELLKTLGANAFWLGQIQYDASNWQATQLEFERYYQYSQRMYELAPDNVDAIMELSYATNSLGSLAMQQQQFDMARKNFEESLRLRLLVQAQQPDNKQLLADNANTRSWLASAALAQGDIMAAVSVHKDIQRAMLDVGSNAELYLLEILVSSYQMSANLLGFLGQYSDALSNVKSSTVIINRALAQDPNSSRWRNSKYYAFYQLLKFSTDLSVQHIKQSPAQLVELLKQDGSDLSATPERQMLARQWLTAAELLMARGEVQTSTTYVQKAMALYNELIKGTSNNLRFRAARANSHLLLAKALYKANLKDAQALCQNALNELSDIVEKNKEPEFTVPYIKALDCLGKLENQSEIVTMLQQQGVIDFNF